MVSSQVRIFHKDLNIQDIDYILGVEPSQPLFSKKVKPKMSIICTVVDEEVRSLENVVTY